MFRCVGRLSDIPPINDVPATVMMDEDTLHMGMFDSHATLSLIKSNRVSNLSLSGGKIKCSDVAFTKLPNYTKIGKYSGKSVNYIVLCKLTMPHSNTPSFLILDNNLRVNCASEPVLISMLIKNSSCCCNVKVASNAIGDDVIQPLGGLTIPTISRTAGQDKVGKGLYSLARRYMI